MNYCIAVVEDNAKETEMMKSMFTRMAQAGADQYDVRYFEGGNAFLSAYQPVYDLVLMDIMLGDSNGMDVARLLRKIDARTLLIFVTSLAQYAVKGYEVNAFDFIVKPLRFPAFRDKVTRALANCMRLQDRELVLEVEEGVYRTSASRIKYIEILSHNIIFHTTEGTLNAYGSLKNVEAMLNSAQFVRCNRSCLVNLAFVRAVQNYDVVVDEETLQISRQRRNDFIRSLNDYIGGNV